MQIKTTLKRFLADESGASLAEYGLLLGLIVVVAIVAVRTLGTSITSQFNNTNNGIQ